MTICNSCGLPHDLPTDADTKVKTHCRACAVRMESHPSTRIEPLEQADLELVLAWRSHPQIYAHFRQQNSPLDWEEHSSWFKSRDEDRYDFMISFDGRRVGVVNIDASNEVGIFLGDFSAHGQGVATAALEWLCHRFADRAPLFAEIHDENEASKRLFKQCGFYRCGRDGEWIQYTYGP